MMLRSLQPWMGAKVTPYKITRSHSAPPPVWPSVWSMDVGFYEEIFFYSQPACISDAGTFDHKKFFQVCGMAGKSADDVKKAFAIIDQDKSGFIEEDELK